MSDAEKIIDWATMELICRWRGGAWDMRKGGDGSDNFYYCNHIDCPGNPNSLLTRPCITKACPIWNKLKEK